VACPAHSSGHQIVGVKFIKEQMRERHEAFGTAKLYVDDTDVGTGAKIQRRRLYA